MHQQPYSSYCSVADRQEAEQAGIVVQQRSVPLKKLQDSMLSGRHLIIALVDKQRLCSNAVWGTTSALQMGSVNQLPALCGCGGAYTGDLHWINNVTSCQSVRSCTNLEHTTPTSGVTGDGRRLYPCSFGVVTAWDSSHAAWCGKLQMHVHMCWQSHEAGRHYHDIQAA